MSNGENLYNNKKLNTAVIALNFVLLAVMIALDICYTVGIGGTVFKGVISFMFVAVGVVNMVYAIRLGVKSKYIYILPAALIVAMAGDVAININFIVGAAVFGLGHVVYVAAYYAIERFKIIDLICAACLFVPAVLIITLVPAFDFGGVVMEIVCVVYALILSTMTGKAISDCIRNLKNKSVFDIVVAVGSILFFISDLALLINNFGAIGSNGRLAMRVLCLGTYYPAQFLLAFSVYIFAKRNIKDSGGETNEEEKGRDSSLRSE